MNAVEIEDAVSNLVQQPFDAAEFPYLFLAAFDNKETTLKRLRKGETNASDVPGGVLQRSNIHIAVCAPGSVTATLKALRDSPKTASAKAKFILATDGVTVEAEELASGEVIAADYADLPLHFGLFLPLAGISAVKEIKNNPIDVKATGRLNKLYVELLKDNPDWSQPARRHDMNHFMARLIFCFFAEKTGIFYPEGGFSATVARMSEASSANTHEVISTLFRAMNTKTADQAQAGLPGWATVLPYVNGGLFSGSTDVPRFSKLARSYLAHVGGLDWKAINPDIFGSMIQAVADDDERGALGMHYTSVPNILKVLNPLFLDDLRSQLDAAGDNARMLLNLRKRMAKIRVFDPACGSGNFLVIAYKQMRAIEAEINRRRGESSLRTEIPLTNFRGIELRDFPAEIARLALIIAEFQCDVLYRGQKEALSEFLPLDAMNWITCGNALRLDWLSICPPTGTGVKFAAEDLFHTPLSQAQIDFENEGGETYVCGNPPYQGSREQLPEQKEDLAQIFEGRAPSWKTLDYVAGWFMKAAEYGRHTDAVAAFVTTNSICQGQQVPLLWPLVFKTGHQIAFAHTSFKWSNLASHNAGVTVAIVGISRTPKPLRKLYSLSADGSVAIKVANHINAYLVPADDFMITPRTETLAELFEMNYGNYPGDGNHLTLYSKERAEILLRRPDLSKLIRPVYGAQEFIKGLSRYCLWIDDHDLSLAESDPEIARRIASVYTNRTTSRDKSLNKLAIRSHQYRDRNIAIRHSILVPTVSSERRDFIPVDLKPASAVTTNQAFALYDAPLWNMALIASRLHLVWIASVCGKLKTDFRYSNTLGWNTFPVPKLTEQHKADLTRCAENILLAREAHFPATIADLYDPEAMPEDLRRAHDENDELLERIYIGRRFKNDTERLEKLFELYTKMTATQPPIKKKGRKAV
ncbi:Type II restriction/modification system, DNA methylase subunit YeeA [Rhodoblastus acidophilus]|uniref:site-specific DNA-methyltransferase (adenine-specific) n=1 Tax=Rhodoblastus acidophilus TaxID=1074 RepID=A0A212SCG6_RHOAC|nr:DNA methyltransferase [Rhodoblastus acidophilus]PPQ35339.1 class I SAM-dependent DNA methyltransferase [Rhodoblastus acidophilus]RAI16963.1 class I SAM-dependent DNA methyltransferase [Rhodoblastus acidophilus]SNB83256.1 Type II restriction/modification system, DNA methylase subunit YeeA [Rhodoblastus acidophilus]